MKAVIVDDNVWDAEILNDFLRTCPQVEVVKTFNLPLLFLEEIPSLLIDVVFMDIDMPIINGLEVIRSIQQPPIVVLTTAHRGYAPEGFELDVADYLVKPFTLQRLKEALAKVEKRISMRAIMLSKEVASALDLGQILIKTSHKTLKYNIASIEVVESFKDYVTYHIGKEKINSVDSLKRLEEILPASHFIRVHRSYIVSRKHIKGWGGNTLILKSGLEIPIGVTYKAELQKLMDE